MVDAAFVPTHKPTGKQDKQITSGVPLSPRQSQQRDEDADFTKKGHVTHHGYKNHIHADAHHKFIRGFCVSSASLHDSGALDDVLDLEDKGSNVYADSAYRSTETEERLGRHGLVSHIHERAYRNTPLTDTQKAANTERSRIRARVEHIFGHMSNAMGGRLIHTMGIDRAFGKVAFKNIAYNMQRFVMLQRRQQEQCV